MVSYTVLIYKIIIFENNPDKPPMNKDVWIPVKFTGKSDVK